MTTVDKSDSEAHITTLDPQLKPYQEAIQERIKLFESWINQIEEHEGGLDQFSKGYEKLGFSVQLSGDIIYREWAPNATSAHLIGDFNGWNRQSHAMEKHEFGVWEICIPAVACQPAIPHNSKITMMTPEGKQIDRLPAWITRAVQDPSISPAYDAIFWNPPEPYRFLNARPMKPQSVRIYEAHIGISTTEHRIGTYAEFSKFILPHIHSLGYNVIQLMAIVEHAYYASFGYQITNFFAASSRYGTPEELMQLVDTAHGMGILVLLDVVHSHACKNVLDGLNMFDGSDHHYFHAGPKGYHELWDSKLFNLGHHEVLRFLLSNLKFYMEVYKFDGFRFDAVTSIMYKHHGIGQGFSGSYHEYFGDDVDLEGVVYLMLANRMLHSTYPNVITIAEDVSGMPGLCLPCEWGGIGFDYRLAMAIPDMWIKLLKEKQDEDWQLGDVCYTLTNRRYLEKTIAYAESHDQALVGDKTLAFWLMDKDMYTNMSILSEKTPAVQRGMTLLNLIKLITHGLGGEGYLNFEGNEFGHPEWLDFPREGNNNSFAYARRQWNLLHDNLLRYKFLNAFDAAMQHLEEKYGWLHSPQAFIILTHEIDRIVVFERAGLVWIFNFHSSASHTDYRVGVNVPGTYRIVLDTDAPIFGGYGLVDHTKSRYFTVPVSWHGRDHSIQIYIPPRAALVLCLEDNVAG